MVSVDGKFEPLAINQRDPIHWAFNEITVNVVRTMLENIGVSETLELVHPGMRYSGRAMARNFTHRFGITEGLEAIALAPFCGICLAWRGKAKMSIYERGVALEYFSCPVSHGPPEICILLSHYCGEGACEEIDVRSYIPNT